MPIQVYKDKTQKNIAISVVGEFVFHVQKDFRNAYRFENPEYSYVIDLKETSYMDSSALGMLLMLWEHVEKDAGKITIINANDRILDILSIAKLDKSFTINA